MDDKIVDFCKQNDTIFDSDQTDKDKLVKTLSGEIKERSVALFGVRNSYLPSYLSSQLTIHRHP